MNVTFEEAEVPTVTRAVDLGPFADKFPLADGKAMKAKVPNNKEGQETVDTLIKQARKAADVFEVDGEAWTALSPADKSRFPKGITARKKSEIVTEGTGKDKKEFILLTIWNVNRIERPRKDADTATE